MSTERGQAIMRTFCSKPARRVLLGLVAVLGSSLFSAAAKAQEILLTGPLAGAPAVRKLRLYREGRFEMAPVVTFTLLDEYQRTILLGGRLNYNFTDWLAIGLWGGTGSVIRNPTYLAEQIQAVNASRSNLPADDPQRLLLGPNLGSDFTQQLAGIDWIAAPQVTAVPFRGKLALFQSVIVDTDVYVFGGPAFVSLTERADCEADCAQSFDMTKRTAIAPTVGLGFSFYTTDWSAFGFDWRAMPFAWNTPGFDVAGGGPEGKSPDGKINADDRQGKVNMMLSVSFSVLLPATPRISE